MPHLAALLEPEQAWVQLAEYTLYLLNLQLTIVDPIEILYSKTKRIQNHVSCRNFSNYILAIEALLDLNV